MRVPWLTVVAPELVPNPLSVNVPVPVLVSPPVPGPISPPKVVLALLPPVVRVPAPRAASTP